MAELYIVTQTGSIQKSIFDMFDIMSELSKYGIVYRKYKSLSSEDINEICTLEKYKAWDVFDSPPLVFDAHYHKGPECRIILRGNVTFFVPVNKMVYELKLGPGEGVTVPDQLVHQFRADEHFTAVRFFTAAEGHVRYNPPQPK